MPESSARDLTASRRIHVVGVGGSGMSKIALVLAAMGHRVSGSDAAPSHRFAALEAHGIQVWSGHDAAHGADAEVLAVSTAIPRINPEVEAARRRHATVLSRADVLSAIASARRTIAVSGTHGKTTTSALLSLILVEAGLDPSYIIGGEVEDLAGGAWWGAGEWFVVEADESDGTFVRLPAHGVVVTSIEPDHLEFWGGFDELVAAFDRFISGADGPRVVCVDDAAAAAAAARHEVTTYGESADAQWRVASYRPDGAGSVFSLVRHHVTVAEVRVPVPGLHNARNACAAIVAATAVGVRLEVGVRAVGRFRGVARRFERRGEAGGVAFVDDYAHLPSEVAGTIAAARAGGWRRVVAVFQPHRYSRTIAIGPTFGDAFVEADLVVVTQLYSHGEPPRDGVTAKIVVDAILEAHPHARVAWIPERADLVRYLTGALRPGDVCLTLGAGDLTTLPDALISALSESSS